MNRILIAFSFLSSLSFGQSYAPAPGNPGSTAIYKDSSIIVEWASGVEILRGPMDLTNSTLGVANYGTEVDAVGMADGLPVSLGDGGVAIITFENGISNGTGPDFAIFENGFVDHYMELGHVEVSSDGVNYFRFPSVSEAPTNVQLDNFSFSNCGYVHNLAGKYRVDFGTPFDLEDLSGTAGLNLNAISHVKIIDAVGSIDPNYGTYDSQMNLINDPFTTPWESSGFDLDAVAVIHTALNAGIQENKIDFVVYPNPFTEQITIKCEQFIYKLIDLQGIVIKSGHLTDKSSVDLSDLSSGCYILYVQVGEHFGMQIITKR